MEIVKHAKSVLEYEKKILVLIFANVIVGAITGFYWYTVYDKYLEKTFKQDYTEFKNLELTAESYSKPGKVDYEEAKLANI
jgi:hypothetical protein|tara:strand:- start:182 stop:424 length:243 start_codon:yes stop_codon:yes gene_type:complete